MDSSQSGPDYFSVKALTFQYNRGFFSHHFLFQLKFGASKKKAPKYDFDKQTQQTTKNHQNFESRVDSLSDWSDHEQVYRRPRPD